MTEDSRNDVGRRRQGAQRVSSVVWRFHTLLAAHQTAQTQTPEWLATGAPEGSWWMISEPGSIGCERGEARNCTDWMEKGVRI